MPVSKKLKKLLNKVRNNEYTNEVLDLPNRNIDNDGATMIANALKKNIHSKEVNLAHNKIGHEGAEALAQLQLAQLDLSCNEIGPEGVLALSKARIESLDLSANSIQAKGAKFFANSLYIT